MISVNTLIDQITQDSGDCPKPLFIDSCASTAYPLDHSYGKIIDGHLTAPFLADALSVCIVFPPPLSHAS